MIRLYIRQGETCRQTVERHAARIGKTEDATRYFDHLVTSGLPETDARWQACVDLGLIGPVRSKYNPDPAYLREGPPH